MNRCYRLNIKIQASIIDLYKKVLLQYLLYGSKLWGIN